MPDDHPLQLGAVLETVLYYAADEDEAVGRFYGDVLNMRPIGRAPGRFQFYRAGSSVFLLFESEQARTQTTPPPHWANGPAHTCFVVDESDYEAWKSHLSDAGVDVLDELQWREGGRSFYFHDPAGNVLEIANRDFWPR